MLLIFLVVLTVFSPNCSTNTLSYIIALKPSTNITANNIQDPIIITYNSPNTWAGSFSNTCTVNPNRRSDCSSNSGFKLISHY